MLLAIALLMTPLAPPSGAAQSPPSPLPQQAMTLVCTGDGDRRARQDNPFGDPGAYFKGDAALELDGQGAARLRLPDPLIPRIHGGGKDGWWPVKDLHVTKAEVRGTVGFNVFDRAHLIVDLGLGIITVDDNLGRFVGRCQPMAPPP